MLDAIAKSTTLESNKSHRQMREFGQGILTAQTQLGRRRAYMPACASASLNAIRPCAPIRGTTSGSQSTPSNFNVRNLAQVSGDRP